MERHRRLLLWLKALKGRYDEKGLVGKVSMALTRLWHLGDVTDWYNREASVLAGRPPELPESHSPDPSARVGYGPPCIRSGRECPRIEECVLHRILCRLEAGATAHHEPHDVEVFEVVEAEELGPDLSRSGIIRENAPGRGDQMIIRGHAHVAGR